ncbi:MAG: hypothetical protein OEY14_14720, partial [Myxococcales bacterium]|nr:hypothetical protein [Myxococcales bacterium]
MLRFLTLSALALALGSSAAPGSAYAQGQGEAEAEADPEGDPGAEAELEADAEAELEADAESEAESVDPADSLEGEPEEPTGRHYAPVQTPPILRTICHGRAIRRVIVEGARRVDDDDVLATIGLRRGIPCTDAEVAQAARALWGLGFFDDIVIAAEPVDEEINLIVRVRERPAIARIVFDGNDEVSQEDLDEKVTLRTGGILSVPDVRTNVTKIRDLYAEEG